MSNAALPGWMLRTSSNVRQWLARSYETINVVGLINTHGPIALRRIFVPPVLSGRQVSEQAPETALHEGGRGLPAWLDRSHDGRGPPILAVSGRAGSGKTTLTHWLALSLAQAAGDTLRWRFQDRLPIPIALRDAPLSRLSGLEELVRWWATAVSGVDPQGIVEWLDYQGTLLILDGLDEVGGRAERERVMGWVREHRWTAGGSDLRNLTLITARPSGFDDVLRFGESDVHRLWMAPFNDAQIRDYVNHWFDLPELRGPESARKASTLLDVLGGPRASESLRTLARRPSYLTVLCAIHHTRGELPHTRAALYKEIISEYIHALDAERGLKTPGARPAWDHPTDKLEVLSAVAFQAHVGAGGSEARPVGDRHMVWTRDELQEAVRRAIEDPLARMQRARPEHAEALTEYFLSRTGLLVETWAGRYQFAHLSFQEYLTARYLLNLAGGSVNLAEFMAARVLPRLGEEGWPEVAMMMLAIDAAERGANYGGVLARLDRTDLGHLRFLSKVLAGEELPLSDAERRAWLLAWLFAAADPHRELDRVPVCELARNRPPLEDFALAAARAQASGAAVDEALTGCFPRAESASMGSLQALLGGPVTVGGNEWEAARRWLVVPSVRRQVSPLVELALAAPLPGQAAAGRRDGGGPPEGLDRALEGIADGVELVRRSSARNRSVSASLWWWVLDGWLRAADGALPLTDITVSGATPLSALLELPGFVPERLLQAPDRVESRLVRWRAHMARSVLEAERAMRVAGLDRPSDRDALALWRSMVDGRHPTRSALKDRPSRRLVEAVPTAPGRRRPFEAWRAIEVYARGYLTFGQREIGEPPATPLELALEPLMALRSDGADKPWRARWGWVMSSLCFLAEVERLSLFSSEPVARPQVEALRATLSDEDRRYDGLDDSSRAVAADEWARLLASPLNPLGMLDIALKGRWRVLSVDRGSLNERIPELVRRLG